MRKRVAIMTLLFLLAAVSIAGCNQKKEEKPITTSATSNLEDEDPKDTMEDDAEDELPVYDVSLPDDMSDFTVAIWGEVYAFPMTYEAFTAKGWEYQGDETDKIGAESYLETEVFANDGNEIEVDLMNTDTQEQTIAACLVAGIHVDAATDKGKEIFINLPGGIIFQSSSAEEVTKAYGTPVDRYEEGNLVQLTYEYGHNKTVKFGFDKEKDILVELDLQNFHLQSDDELLADVKDAVTPEVLAYKKPGAEEGNLTSAVVTYGGDLYSVPAPVSEFQKNGWTVNDKESDRAVREGKYGYVTLTRDGQKLYSMVKNFGSEPATIKSCFVTNVYGDMDTTKVPVSVAGGITLGMQEKDFLERSKGDKPEKTNDEEKKMDVYSFYFDTGKINGIMVYIDRDLKIVRQIQVVNDVFNPAPESDAAAETEGEVQR